jgi:hypothetical protein
VVEEGPPDRIFGPSARPRTRAFLAHVHNPFADPPSLSDALPEPER